MFTLSVLACCQATVTLDSKGQSIAVWVREEFLELLGSEGQKVVLGAQKWHKGKISRVAEIRPACLHLQAVFDLVSRVRVAQVAGTEAKFVFPNHAGCIVQASFDYTSSKINP